MTARRQPSPASPTGPSAAWLAAEAAFSASPAPMPAPEPVAEPVARPVEAKVPRVFQVEAPTPGELTRELAAVTATLEALRRAPRLDFEVRPNQQAWARLARAADDLMADILAARRR